MPILISGTSGPLLLADLIYRSSPRPFDGYTIRRPSGDHRNIVVGSIESSTQTSELPGIETPPPLGPPIFGV
jgi:hypothetical protein